jgi:hypothetical protein
VRPSSTPLPGDRPHVSDPRPAPRGAGSEDG